MLCDGSPGREVVLPDDELLLEGDNTEEDRDTEDGGLSGREAEQDLPREVAESNGPREEKERDRAAGSSEVGVDL
eukprot:33655-Hanusia_phi.AAC.1